MNIFFTLITFLLFFSSTYVKANLAYITNEKDNTVSVIDIAKKKSYKNSKGWAKT